MPDFALELAIGGRIAGIDEAGCAPLAGPVVAAAVVIDRQRFPAALAEQIDDSKKLRRALRETLCLHLTDCAEYGVGVATVEEIDRLNILQARLLAMARALACIEPLAEHALVDGNRAPALPCAVTTVVGGDGKALSIAAASIVAKVTRDRMMRELAALHPGYGWETNVGYGTAAHYRALSELGPTPHHRRSFKPVAAFFK